MGKVQSDTNKKVNIFPFDLVAFIFAYQFKINHPGQIGRRIVVGFVPLTVCMKRGTDYRYPLNGLIFRPVMNILRSDHKIKSVTKVGNQFACDGRVGVLNWIVF